MYKSIISATAKQEIKEIAIWYNSKQKGLGKHFTQTVKKAIAHIRLNPRAFEERQYQIRVATTQKFPFLVYYYIDEVNQTVIITAVFHTSRKPKK